MSRPIAWDILQGTEPKKVVVTEKEKEYARIRLSEIGNKKPTWSEVELKMEIEYLKAVINS